MFSRSPEKSGYKGKRLLDLAVAVPALVLSIPLQAAAAIAVRLSMGSPVLFRQQRPGLHGQPFQMIKFRTMHDFDEGQGRTDDASRLSPLGSLLRSTSVDELPSLWSVVRGDMSIVGPRPLLTDYLDLYTPEQARRHEVLPGLTGLAQINGRNNLDWASRFAADVTYIETQSIGLDIAILVKTMSRVIGRDDVAASGHATVEPFTGSQKPRV